MASKGKTVALITGANQGIGFETAKKLAAEHKDYVVIAAGRRKDAIEEATKKLQAEGLAVEPLVLDQTSDDSIHAAIQEIEQKYGRLDVLINNAAISYAPANTDGSSVSTRAEMARVFDTNITGVAVLTDAAIELMKKSIEPGKPKRIVFVSSTLGSLTYKADPKARTHNNVARTYTTSKAALNMLAWHYIVDFEKDKTNWKINCTCPGYCATNLNDYAGLEPPENGAINSVRLATLGPDGETGTYTNKEGTIPW